MTENDFFIALKKAYERAGTQQRLADQLGLSQSTIAGYFSGRYSVGNMTVSTLCKLFPDMVINFFGDKTDGMASDILFDQLAEIYNGLDDRGKVSLVAMAAANFGDKIREKTRK